MNFLLHITFVLHMKESDAQMCHMIYGKPQRERVLEPRFQTTSSGSTAHSTMLRWHLRNVCLAEASRMFRVAVSGQGAGSGEQAAKRQAKDELRHLQSHANHSSLRWSTVLWEQEEETDSENKQFFHLNWLFSYSTLMLFSVSLSWMLYSKKVSFDFSEEISRFSSNVTYHEWNTWGDWKWCCGHTGFPLFLFDLWYEWIPSDQTFLNLWKDSIMIKEKYHLSFISVGEEHIYKGYVPNSVSHCIFIVKRIEPIY